MRAGPSRMLAVAPPASRSAASARVAADQTRARAAPHEERRCTSCASPTKTKPSPRRSDTLVRRRATRLGGAHRRLAGASPRAGTRRARRCFRESWKDGSSRLRVDRAWRAPTPLRAGCRRPPRAPRRRARAAASMRARERPARRGARRLPRLPRSARGARPRADGRRGHAPPRRGKGDRMPPLARPTRGRATSARPRAGLAAARAWRAGGGAPLPTHGSAARPLVAGAGAAALLRPVFVLADDRLRRRSARCAARALGKPSRAAAPPTCSVSGARARADGDGARATCRRARARGARDRFSSASRSAGEPAARSPQRRPRACPRPPACVARGLRTAPPAVGARGRASGQRLRAVLDAWRPRQQGLVYDKCAPATLAAWRQRGAAPRARAVLATRGARVTSPVVREDLRVRGGDEPTRRPSRHGRPRRRSMAARCAAPSDRLRACAASSRRSASEESSDGRRASARAARDPSTAASPAGRGAATRGSAARHGESQRPRGAVRPSQRARAARARRALAAGDARGRSAPLEEPRRHAAARDRREEEEPRVRCVASW